MWNGLLRQDRQSRLHRADACKIRLSYNHVAKWAKVRRGRRTYAGTSDFFSCQLVQYSFHSAASPAGAIFSGCFASSIIAYSLVRVMLGLAFNAFGCGP